MASLLYLCLCDFVVQLGSVPLRKEIAKLYGSKISIDQVSLLFFFFFAFLCFSLLFFAFLCFSLLFFAFLSLKESKFDILVCFFFFFFFFFVFFFFFCVLKILVHAGAQEAIHNFCKSVLGPTDHVVVMSPCYQSLEECPKSAGASVSLWQVYTSCHFFHS